MNKYKLEFSKEAKKDLIDIVTYIKYNLQEPSIAKKLHNKIKDAIYMLCENPKSHPLIDDKHLKELTIRKLIIDNYIVFYQIADIDKKIYIVRIMYEKRNWMNLL